MAKDDKDDDEADEGSIDGALAGEGLLGHSLKC
jgi:hypothetical protein